MQLYAMSNAELIYAVYTMKVKQEQTEQCAKHGGYAISERLVDLKASLSHIHEVFNRT